MTTASIERTEDGTRISVEGHTQPEICAAVTNLFNAVLNALVDLDLQGVVQILSTKAGDGSFSLEYTGEAEQVMLVLVHGFELLQTNFPDCFVFEG